MNAKQLQAATVQLNTLQARASARLVEPDELREAARAVTSLRRYATRIGADPETCRVVVDGGGVPKKYNNGHGGTATTVTVSATGARSVRERARSGAYGPDPLFRGHVENPDTVKTGAEWPAATILGRKVQPRKYGEWLYFDQLDG